MNNSNFFQKSKQIIKYISLVLSWTLFVVLILIISFLVYYLVCTNLYAKNGDSYAPSFSLYTIVSPSMEPTINVYDVIVTKKIEPKDIKVNDIITFISTSSISEGMTVTHRVVSIVNGPNGVEFKTKGDNNLSADSDTAKSENLLGKVIFKVPQLGRLQFFLASKGGWLLVVLFPALYIIINDIFKILKLNNAKKKIDELEDSKEDEEKIKLESSRKEELKEKLNKINEERSDKLQEQIKEHDLEHVYNSKLEESKIVDNSINSEEINKIKKNIFDEIEESNVFTESSNNPFAEFMEKPEKKSSSSKGIDLPKLK